MTSFADAFPAWRHVTGRPEDQRWQLAARAGDQGVLHYALTLLDDELEAAWPRGPDAVLAVAVAVTEDAAEAGPAHRTLTTARAASGLVD